VKLYCSTERRCSSSTLFTLQI